MNRNAQLLHPRDELMHAMQRIYRYRMTTTSGGNLSIREPNGDIWITPARVDKGGLRREDIVRVAADGTVEGPHRPSSEYPFHRAIYDRRPEVRAVVHAHPVALVAFSLCGQVPNTRLLPQSWRVCGETGFAPYALPGSAALGEAIAGTFARGFDSAVLENHGVVTAGLDLQGAFERFETLEFTAKTIIKASHLAPPRYLDDGQLAMAAGAVPDWPALTPGPAGSREKELRRQLCEFVRRAYAQRLMISTEGAFSARLDADAILVTPHRLDRNALEVEDIVLVREGAAEAGKVPSQATRNHLAIYAQHPEFQALVNAYPVNATAFSAARAWLDSRTIPESYIFLREVPLLPYGIQFADGRELASRVGPKTPVALLENDGALVGGKSVLDTFDALEVLEATAEAMINALAIGTPHPMGEPVIRELRQAFLGEA